MKLYYYEHCPFCVRARMALAFADIAYDKEILASDDEETPNRLIGAKMLPILIKEDGTAMGESLDIVKYIDTLRDQPLDQQLRPEIEEAAQAILKQSLPLTIPRNIRLGLEEFSTQSAVDYYSKKKTEKVGDFAENIANTAEYIAQLSDELAHVDQLIKSEDAANGQAPSMEDIHLFSVLRNLTAVKDIEWREKTRAYLESMSKQSHVDLFFDRAI